MKRRAELRTTSVGMTAHKYTDLKTLRVEAEVWGVQNIQPFFPPIEKLFKTTLLENSTEYGIRFESEITQIKTEDLIVTNNGPVQVHKKITMLLSPFKCMQGDYGQMLGLPSTTEQSMLAHNKVQNSNNAAYVGAMISAVLGNSGCEHFPTVYGIFTGLKKSHTIDISDDYGDLSERSWFSQNIGKTFNVKLSEEIENLSEFKHTRSARVAIQLGEDIVLDSVEEVAGIPGEGDMADTTRVFHDEEEESDNSSDSSSVSTSYIFGVKSCDCEDDEEEECEESDEPFAWATFSNVPVQITLMERCEGTLYELFSNNDSSKHLAWLAQVMFALAFAQRNFAFTHNDLHANNVMYIPTNKEFLYYNCGGTFFGVPTFGYLIKIIDFERGIASIKLNGMKEAKVFMSDHFSPDEEAGGQYNSEPFYTPKQKEVKPNPSFDLVRLATSMFWDLYPDGPTGEYSDPVFRLFMKWLTLEDGTSIMFGNGKHDRYHGFHLYKAIARFCKDAIPRKEVMLLKPVFGIETLPQGASVCSIDF